ncbi:thiol:disulfide interchange protein DsbC [Chromobacterium alkanivorans]|uniref:DsbC family protein n=1 Tax=Chromobacterium TaxID=535 RepID=UPI000652A2D5|nr:MULTISPECIES: DsbC family protein [Chromobacterium]KMN76686.1 thiol:disulfide interchange protein [Chromobacterium sp. LK11]MBN3006199.1 DsbC family protein [Chromobacterium alkanivorans]MCS3804757.1 thiol:disulfide interchange protein DsbC [Chromobacterium alkanivorans]MCS3819096.1 thiol:disulfide interchange protein DsbC [Chromobacterium alkanivorans]MCS3873046.1 thiol:disulfide interchange protein DsbC [Chromobacterium alkanivorans]
MKKNLKSLALGASLMMALAACSQAAGSGNAGDVKKAFEGRFPGKPVKAVTATPVKGIYEVVVDNKQVVYTNADASYLFVGDLIDAVKKESLTEKKMAELNKVDFKSLPFEYALKEVRGKGERKLAVFSDPDCPFCKKLEREGLKNLDNVTIYTFLYPLSQLHPDAMRKSKQIWCSPDKVAAWSGFMLDGKPLTGPDNCDTPLEKIQQLGEKLGITGTPGLIFANGQLVPGAIDGDDIEKLLNAK